MKAEVKLESLQYILRELVDINSEMLNTPNLDRPYLEGLRDAYLAVLKMLEVNNE
jgi:hypothetical protein